jgi:hypothetical protein
MLGLIAAVAQEAPERPKDNQKHGAASTYDHGCRCQDCRDANAQRHKRWRLRAAHNPQGADRAGHGKAGTYNNHGCRCEPCTQAHMARMNAYRAGRAARKAAAA